MLYLLMGVIVGILIKHEIDLRAKKKRILNKAGYIKATADVQTIKQYDEVLQALRGINQSLSTATVQKQKKEV
jgi:hypothetical protein